MFSSLLAASLDAPGGLAEVGPGVPLKFAAPAPRSAIGRGHGRAAAPIAGSLDRPASTVLTPTADTAVETVRSTVGRTARQVHAATEALPAAVAAVAVHLGAVPVHLGAVSVGLGAVPVHLGAVPVDLGAVRVELGAVPVEVSSLPGGLPQAPIGTPGLPEDAASAGYRDTPEAASGMPAVAVPSPVGMGQPDGSTALADGRPGHLPTVMGAGARDRVEFPELPQPVAPAATVPAPGDGARNSSSGEVGGAAVLTRTLTAGRVAAAMGRTPAAGDAVRGVAVDPSFSPD